MKNSLGEQQRSPDTDHAPPAERTAPPVTPGRFPSLSRPVRRLCLVVHVVVSVSWLGVSLCMLTMSLMGATSDVTATDEVAYRAMKTFGDWLLVPVALLAPTTGLILALGTHWGVARHRWVYTKFWMTLTLAALSLFAFRSDLHHAADLLSDGEPVPAEQLLYGPSVSVASFAFIITVSLLKPWGRTKRGQRRLEAERAARDGRKSGGSRTGDPAA